MCKLAPKEVTVQLSHLFGVIYTYFPTKQGNAIILTMIDVKVFNIFFTSIQKKIIFKTVVLFNCSTKEVVSFSKILLVLDSYH